MTLRTERLRRPQDEAPCDHCGRPLRTEDHVTIHLPTSLIFCSAICAHDYDRQAFAEAFSPEENPDSEPVPYDPETWTASNGKSF
jgi:hypothetical protein